MSLVVVENMEMDDSTFAQGGAARLYRTRTWCPAIPEIVFGYM
jgi:hypothetical protein